jgi:hypothetical protein
VNPSWRGDQDKLGARARKMKTRSLSCGRDHVQIGSELS